MQNHKTKQSSGTSGAVKSMQDNQEGEEEDIYGANTSTVNVKCVCVCVCVCVCSTDDAFLGSVPVFLMPQTVVCFWNFRICIHKFRVPMDDVLILLKEHCWLF